jgi:hypothetical protein
MGYHPNPQNPRPPTTPHRVEPVFLDGAFVAGFGFVVLETGGEFVGVVEDVLDRSGHQVSRNLSRAGMA